MSGRSRTGTWATLAVAVLATTLAVWAIVTSSAPPDGPVPVAWDATRCARCGMLVSEPGFAAQLHLRDGRVLHFDDPGCLLVHRHTEGLDAAAAWFHHHDQDRWLPGDRVAFERVETSPMGFGLAARERGEPNADLDLAAATALALARDRSRAGAGGAPAP